MAGRGSAPGERRGGRQKGVPNKAPKKPRARKPKAEQAPSPRQMAKALADTFVQASREGVATEALAAADPALAAVVATPVPIGEAGEIDVLDALEELCVWAIADWRRLRALPGQREVVVMNDGARPVVRTAEQMASLARQFATDALPYRKPRVSPIDGSRGGGVGRVVVNIQRQGDSESITVGVAA